MAIKKPKVEETVEAPVEAAEAAAPAPKAAKDVAVVSWRGGKREFSKAVHGDDFKDLAASFAAKFGGTVV